MRASLIPGRRFLAHAARLVSGAAIALGTVFVVGCGPRQPMAMEQGRAEAIVAIGDPPRPLLALRIALADGSSQVVVNDGANGELLCSLTGLVKR